MLFANGAGMMFYFAYGSNMREAQMVERCPSARFVGIAALRSKHRKCGIAGAIEACGHLLWESFTNWRMLMLAVGPV
jgi:hypothetical protein